MNPSETADLLELIRRLRDDLKITIVMVAHDIPLVMNLCDRIQVLNYGKLIAEGDPAPSATTLKLSRPTWARHTMLELRDLHVSYGGHPCPQWRQSERR